MYLPFLIKGVGANGKVGMYYYGRAKCTVSFTYSCTVSYEGYLVGVLNILGRNLRFTYNITTVPFDEGRSDGAFEAAPYYFSGLQVTPYRSGDDVLTLDTFGLLAHVGFRLHIECIKDLQYSINILKCTDMCDPNPMGRRHVAARSTSQLRFCALCSEGFCDISLLAMGYLENWLERAIVDAGPIQQHLVLTKRPQALLIVRSFCGVYFLITLICSFAQSVSKMQYFFYFTNLSFVTVTIYFLINAALTRHCVRAIERGEDPMGVYKYRSSETQSTHSFLLLLLYELVLCEQTLVPAVYWSLLVGMYKESWTSVTMHALSTAAVLLDSWLVPRPIVLSHMPVWLSLSAVYLAWCLFAAALVPIPKDAFVHEGQTRFWVYWFLDLTQPFAPAWYLGLIALFVFWFWLVHRIRPIVGDWLCPMASALDQEGFDQQSYELLAPVGAPPPL
eukprot:g43650.t1